MVSGTLLLSQVSERMPATPGYISTMRVRVTPAGAALALPGASVKVTRTAPLPRRCTLGSPATAKLSDAISAPPMVSVKSALFCDHTVPLRGSVSDTVRNGWRDHVR